MRSASWTYLLPTLVVQAELAGKWVPAEREADELASASSLLPALVVEVDRFVLARNLLYQPKETKIILKTD